jgi:hypothetical protein
MNAYVITATMPSNGPSKVRMILYSSGTKQEAEAVAKSDGWVVKRATQATAADLEEIEEYSHVLRSVKKEIAARAADALRKKQLEAAKRDEEAERARKQMDDAVEANSRRLQFATEAAAGDIIAVEIENHAHDDAKIAQICAKIDMFFSRASVNRKEIYTSIGLDFAEIQGQRRLPRACEVVGAILKDLDSILAIDSRMQQGEQQLESERQAVNGQINSIASRTHIYGGSGLFLLFSAMDAESAVKRDEQAINHLRRSYRRQVADFQGAVHQAVLRRRYHEFRAQMGVAMLRNAPGSPVTFDMSPELADYVRWNHASLRS